MRARRATRARAARRPAASTLALLWLTLGIAGCFGRGNVTRVVDGQPREGRGIDEAAYASYLRAAFLESVGDREHALEELERALDADPVSPEILTRIGEVRCGTNLRLDAPPPAADAARASLLAFSRALGLDGSYAPAWYGRARCLERTGQRAAALAAAERAAYYDPLRVECTVTVARLLFALGRPAEAFAWLDAFALYHPASVDAERARLRAAERHGTRARAERSRNSLAALGRDVRGADRAALERALREDDLEAARASAVALRMPSAELALEAAQLAPELAYTQALMVLRADPSESTAWVAALVAADRLGDEQRLADALDELAFEPLPVSPRALELLAELIQRRAGPDAAEAFRRALASPAR
jgi:tetratricopeptide (TPR) repeat protein